VLDSKTEDEVSGVFVAADTGCVAGLLLVDCVLALPAVTAAEDNLIVDGAMFARSVVHNVTECDVDCPLE
jgi:hypothetical protein